MIVLSTRPKTVFIHVPKTAGCSIKAALGQMLTHENYDQQFRHATLDVANEIFNRHTLPTKKLGDRLFFSFAFVRNPWDRVLSWHAMSHRRQRVPIEVPYNFTLPKDQLQEILRTPPISTCQIDCITDRYDAMVDFVGRFENLDRDFRRLCHQLKILPPILPRLNSSPHDNYQMYYDDETRDIVAEHYKKDIEAFGYTF